MTDYYDTFTWHTYAGKRNLRIKIKRLLIFFGIVFLSAYLTIWLWNFYTSF